MRMNVLIVAPFDAKSIHSIRWVQRLLAQNVDCYVLSMTEEPIILPADNFHLVKIPRFSPAKQRIKFFPGIRSLFDFVELFTQVVYVNRLIRSISFDLINIQWLFHGLGFATTFQKAVPIVSTPWGSDLLMPSLNVTKCRTFKKRFVNRLLVNRIIRKSSAFTCDAKHMKEALIARGAESSRIELIYFGTNVDFYSPIHMNQNIREEYQITASTVMVLSNRSLESIYDIPTLFRAIARLKETNVDLRFVIAGGGSMRAELEHLASRLEIQHLLVFTGRIDDKRFRDLVASTDIYVSTSPTDGGIAASVAEAMACEKPVIITKFGDNEYWLNNQTAGLSFESGNDEELSDKIQLLARDSAMRKSMGAVGRDIVVRKNNAQIEVKKVIALFQRVANDFKSLHVKK